MERIDIWKVANNSESKLFKMMPRFLKRFVIWCISKIIHLKEINEFIENNKDKNDFDFIDEVFEMLDFSYSMSTKDKERIPAEGKIICVANHTLGGLDGLALIRAIGEVRPDIKVVVNDVLSNIDNLNGVFLPYNIFNPRTQKENIRRIEKELEKEGCILFFPAATVSRMTLKGITDSEWHRGAHHFAQKHKSSILPIYVKARNSWFFYLFSIFFKNLSYFLLPHEVFNKKHKTIQIKVGDQVPLKSFENTQKNQIMKLLKRHTYLVGKNKTGVFKTETAIVHPVDRQELKKELLKGDLIGKTRDEKKIYLIDYDNFPVVMREIGRLRELTFRKVGEGTGKKIDLDDYDKHYHHLVLWDDTDLEIVGSYRIGIVKEILNNIGTKGLYSYSLFEFSDEFSKHIENAIELGRSFVQQKYWNSYALDYLWQGIGAFLVKNPEIEYMFGPVSISNHYPDEVKDMIIYFYQKWYGGDTHYILSSNRYTFTEKRKNELSEIFKSDDLKGDYRILEENVKGYGHVLPVLYKQYSKLSNEGGVKFLDFSVDESFGNCVDGLIKVEIAKVRQDKLKRYMKSAE